MSELWQNNWSVSIQNFYSGDKDPLSQDEYQRRQQSQNGGIGGGGGAEVSKGVGSDGGQSTDDSAADPHHQTQPQTNSGGAASYTERGETQGYFCAMHSTFWVVYQAFFPPKAELFAKLKAI